MIILDLSGIEQTEAMKGMDIPVQKHHPLYMRMCTKEGSSLGSLICYPTYNALLLEPEWPINN